MPACSMDKRDHCIRQFKLYFPNTLTHVCNVSVDAEWMYEQRRCMRQWMVVGVEQAILRTLFCCCRLSSAWPFSLGLSSIALGGWPPDLYCWSCKPNDKSVSRTKKSTKTTSTCLHTFDRNCFLLDRFPDKNQLSVKPLKWQNCNLYVFLVYKQYLFFGMR